MHTSNWMKKPLDMLKRIKAILSMLFAMSNTWGKLTITFNPFHETGLFLCPQKTLGNLLFSDVFQGV